MSIKVPRVRLDDTGAGGLISSLDQLFLSDSLQWSLIDTKASATFASPQLLARLGTAWGEDLQKCSPKLCLVLPAAVG